jgi:hypothetical protein
MTYGGMLIHMFFRLYFEPGIGVCTPEAQRSPRKDFPIKN